MNSKNISKALNAKLKSWTDCIDDKNIVDTIKENAIITGGALVSLLTGEEPNDYDVYFKTHDSCLAIAKYYAKIWNVNHTGKSTVEVQDNNARIECFIRSSGIAEEEQTPENPEKETEPYTSENEDMPTEEFPDVKTPKYRPRYFTTNAISLSDKIQLVIRFYGEVSQIHENYDFEHCKCSYDWANNNVNLPVKALECIINKELYYSGSKYPLCSIIRTRKFIERGWHINAGQYVKMALQLNELNLKDFNVFKEQLMGVDSAYFEEAITAVQNKQSKDPDFKPDNTYLFEIINRIF